jgi:hypothetical protein
MYAMFGLSGANIASGISPRLERVLGYHAGRPWSLLVYTAACVSLLACSCSGWTRSGLLQALRRVIREEVDDLTAGHPHLHVLPVSDVEDLAVAPTQHLE